MAQSSARPSGRARIETQDAHPTQAWLADPREMTSLMPKGVEHNMSTVTVLTSMGDSPGRTLCEPFDSNCPVGQPEHDLTGRDGRVASAVPLCRESTIRARSETN